MTRDRRYPGRSGDHNLFLSEPFVEEQKRLLSRSAGKKLAKRGDAAIMDRRVEIIRRTVIEFDRYRSVRNFFQITFIEHERNTRRVYILYTFIRELYIIRVIVLIPFRLFSLSNRRATRRSELSSTKASARSTSV